MKRFKTKQEISRINKKRYNIAYPKIKELSLFGLPYDEKYGVPDYDSVTTTDPHPFEGLKFEVGILTPKQSRKVQKKAFMMGYYWGVDTKEVRNSNGPFLQFSCFREKRLGFNRQPFDGAPIKLTYKQFMNGTVPKKKEQPLKFKEWKVEQTDETIKVGGMRFSRHAMNLFDNVCQKTEGHATPNEIYDFLKANKSRLGL